MGSADLIKHVESVHQPFHIKEYAGKTLVVDGRAWLWQSASKYAVELATNDKTELYVSFICFSRHYVALATPYQFFTPTLHYCFHSPTD